MERLTDTAWRNLDPWECCGQDDYCQRGSHDKGGCANGCIVPRLYHRLAAYEDTGYEPEEITALQEDNERLHKLLDNLEAVLTSKPPEHNSGNDDKVHCKDCDYLNMDSGKPYCCHPRMSTNGLDDWCNFGTKRQS